MIRAIHYRIDWNLAGWSGIILSVEEQELDPGGRSRKQTEVDAAVKDRCAKR
jgi:hypothetical protein